MKTGDLVIVATEGGRVGQVKYTTADGRVGVALVNERGRVDEWHPTQVCAVTPEEAAKAVAKGRVARRAG